MHRQIAGKLTGPVTKWIVLAAWLVAFVGLGAFSSKLAEVQNNEAASWLPARDGIVASLYLVAQRRAGRPTGWVPWVALVVGTLASLAANVAVGGDDIIGKALAGWPALSMLAAVKSRATWRLTSASSRARRISRIAFEITSSSRRPPRPRPERVA